LEILLKLCLDIKRNLEEIIRERKIETILIEVIFEKLYIVWIDRIMGEYAR